MPEKDTQEGRFTVLDWILIPTSFTIRNYKIMIISRHAMSQSQDPPEEKFLPGIYENIWKPIFQLLTVSGSYHAKAGKEVPHKNNCR